MTCMLLTLNQKILRYLAREVSLYVRPTVLLVWIHLLCYVKIVNTFFFGQIQTSKTGGQLYGDTSPYKISK